MVRVLLAALVLPLLAAADLASARTLAGQLVEAGQPRLDGSSIVLGESRLELKELDWLDFGERPEPPAKLAVLLADGGWLPAQEVKAGGADAVQVTTAWGELELPLGEAVLGWGAPAWLAEVLAETGDRDRLLIGSGDTAQEWPGELTGIADGKLGFEAGSVGAIARPVAEVAGLRLAIAPSAAKGLRLMARPQDDLPGFFLSLSAGRPALLGGKHPLRAWPSGKLRLLGGQRTFLSELEPVPAETMQEGAFGVIWPWKRDRNLDGSPLLLGGVRHESGVVVHSRSRLVWALGKRYARLETQIGIADLVGREGDCEVMLAGDGKELWSHRRLRGGETPHRVSVDVSGVERLELRVEFGQRYDIGDHVALADAWLLHQ